MRGYISCLFRCGGKVLGLNVVWQVRMLSDAPCATTPPKLLEAILRTPMLPPNRNRN